MPRVKVTPILGEVDYKSRLGSLRACHVLGEKSIVKGFNPDEVGKAITEAIQEIMMFEVSNRNLRAFRPDSVKVLVEFRLDE